MSGPFATYFGNQRTVAIPVTPTAHTQAVINANGTVGYTALTLGSNNTAGTSTQIYIYYLHMTSDLTGAASGITVLWQLQYQTAAHVAVGAAIPIGMGGGVGCSGATCQLSHILEDPCYPIHLSTTVPATAAEIAIQSVAFGLVGAPVCRAFVGWGIDTLNLAPTGDIGGAGIAAQAATSPNAF